MVEARSLAQVNGPVHRKRPYCRKLASEVSRLSGRLEDRIRAERGRQFVGRAEEIDLFTSVIGSRPMPHVVLAVYGPGGVGKTTLLRQFESICRAKGVSSCTLDGRYLQPNPDLFVDALCRATGQSGQAEAMAALAAEGRGVLFVDTYEAIEPLDGWLRETFIPQLPENVLVVLLGRKRPSVGWRSDVWQSLCRAAPLRNLSAVESRSYLSAQTVPPSVHDQIVHMTHGFPLALSLVAENYAQTGAVGLGPDPSLDIVSALLDRFVENVEEPVQRDLLEICSLVRMTTEALIADVLRSSRTPELFAWLKSLSFMEVTPFGLMPHDLAREAIATDLRWRNADRYSEFHHRVRAYYADRLERATGPAQQLILFDYIYLHRDNPVMEPFFRWHSHDEAFADSARIEDLSEIVRIVEKHEGSESAGWARYWFERQPEGFLVMRDSFNPHRLKGLLASLNLTPIEAVSRDPATSAALRHLEATSALTNGERATYFRFWMADDDYQNVSSIQSTLFVSIVQHYLTTQNLAMTYLPCADAGFWAPMFHYAMHELVEPAAFDLDGRRYGVYGFDWRALPPKPWLERLSEQEVPIKASAERPKAAADLVVLSREGFEESVSEALKSYTNPPKLALNPLLKSRLIVERVSPDADTKERILRLRELLKEAGESLRESSKEEKLYLALDTCYFRPMRSQEVAAEKVDVSIATFRRHLKAGTARVTELLWQQETG